jgi:hypothetical protein
LCAGIQLRESTGAALLQAGRRRSCALKTEGEKRGEIADFAVPPDVDPALLAGAIETKLRVLAGPVFGPRIRMPRLLVRAPGGRLLVPKDVLRRLGGGDVERGRRFLERVVRGFRSRTGG